jgi:2,4-dienoyl-CoA reductase-like NADH-dependent reductase (Old Yellow Enzyme family)
MENVLFQPMTINQTIIKNRFVMSAAADNIRDEDMRLKRFTELAKGGIGLIISGGMREAEVTKWRQVVEVIHAHGGKFAIQIVPSAGPGKASWSNEDKDMVAMSVLSSQHPYFNRVIQYGKHHAATEEELADIVQTYGRAASNAKAIGADAVQVHAAHQNFLSHALSPLMNLRTDRWGGSISNRTRIHREIYRVMRQAVGADFPILIKLGVQDALPGGLQFQEGKKAAELIAECGYDALEISQGLQDLGRAMEAGDFQGTPMRTNIRRVTDEGYFRSWCREIKALISKPTILTGGLRSFELIEEIVKNHETDFMGLCRPFIREPGKIRRWQEGDHRKATCISCNKCVMALAKGLPLTCLLDQRP